MTTAWNLPPQDIEDQSFAIIDQEAGAHDWPPEAWRIVRRMIHTTADFEFVSSVRMHPQAVRAGLEALSNQTPIFTDTRMALMGISRKRLDRLGCESTCLMDKKETFELAAQNGTTRALAAVDIAINTIGDGIYVIGNAPTALFRLIEHVKAGRVNPRLIVGLPVGFVNAAESKEALLDLSSPFITNAGRKGGSALAASVINQLAVMVLEKWPDAD